MKKKNTVEGPFHSTNYHNTKHHDNTNELKFKF